MHHRTLVGALAVAALVAWSGPALAGGWAVVTLDRLPQSVRAGEQISLGFMVRQHGTHPFDSDAGELPQLFASRQDGEPGTAFTAPSERPVRAGGETIQVAARKEGPAGHYVVDVTFPNDGVWEWEIVAPPFDGTTFAPLTVLPAGTPDASAAPAWPPLPLLLRGAGAALLAAGLVVGLASLRPRRRGQGLGAEA